MTTGRINQVTISICATARRLWHSTTYSRLATLSLAGVRYKALLLPLRESPRNLGPRSNRSCTSRAKVNERNTLFPVLTSFRSALRVHRTRITTFNEDYQQPDAPERRTQSRRIPDDYLRLVWPSASNPHPPSLQAHVSKGRYPTIKRTSTIHNVTHIVLSIPIQYTLLDRSIHASVHSTPVCP